MAPNDRDDPGRHARLRRPARDPEANLTEPTRDDLERDPAQEAWGNAALVDLAAMQGFEPGAGAALRALRADRRAARDPTPQHGGDPDPVVDAPLTEEDLDPRIRGPAQGRGDPTSSDAPEPGGLPDEDTAWLERLDPAAGDALPTGLLEPSADALRDGLGPWVRSLAPWLGPSPALRLLVAVFATPAPCLQDPTGRPVLARARVAAGATALATRAGPSAELARYLAEIAAARPLVDALEHEAAGAHTLPSSRDFVQRALTTRQSSRGDIAPEASDPVRRALVALVALPRAIALVPRSASHPPSDDEDPLGLDRFLDTRAQPADPEDDARRACLDAAERLAGRVSALGARLAGAAVALIRATPTGRSAPGRADLLGTMQRVDQESRRILHLLLDVAEAARMRAVSVGGLRNGLRHAARALDALHDGCLEQLARIGSAHVGGLPSPAPRQGPDPLDVALVEGCPEAARPWIAALPDGPDRALALLLLDALLPLPPEPLLDRVRAVSAELGELGDPVARAALRQLEGGLLVWSGRADEALALARAELDAARHGREGARAAAATMLAMEALRATGADEAVYAARDAGGRLLRSLGSPALTLLARWRPPSDEQIGPQTA